MAIQKIGFFAMLHQVYGAVGSLASAVGRGANALDNLGKWAEEQTATFVEEAQIERHAKVEQLRMARAKQLKLIDMEDASVSKEGKEGKSDIEPLPPIPAV